MAYLLAIETATKVCSVALFKDDKLLQVKEEKGAYSHAENLAEFTSQLLTESNLDAKDLSGIVVSKGPGSYTGLRIGVSFAKGLCYSLKIPLISIDTIYALALGWVQAENPKVDLICPMIDARRMEVYSAIYNFDLKCLKPISADVIEIDSYSELLQDKIAVFVGDGAEKCQSLLEGKNRTFRSDFLPSAAYLGKEGYHKYQQSKIEDVAYFEPYYLKEFVALKSQKGSLD
ncbi:tRNA (adenosine(37)-N6)-threonylcarbamoyltransferase complex dimerization subunit type 1 TsaB [Vicingaceae bacterium]|nr:tRNA (adenosine(37)-N6)-threonylcarbamoyltransferase complex dimerization subunit type 1 TsaB [Vicingaceae bacterium]